MEFYDLSSINEIKLRKWFVMVIILNIFCQLQVKRKIGNIIGFVGKNFHGLP